MLILQDIMSQYIAGFNFKALFMIYKNLIILT